LPRLSKIDYYINIAREVAKRSPCNRRKFGAVLVKDGAIIATGYNGAIRGAYNCGEDGICIKDVYNEARYTSYNYCPAIHAEQNAVINAARVGTSTIGATLYLSPLEQKDGDRPCYLCRRFIVNAGVKDCYYFTKDGKIRFEDVQHFWVKLENEWIDEQLSVEGIASST
jgi:dCMP deaminase